MAADSGESVHFKESFHDEDLPAPTGTIFVLTVYLAVLAGMWGAVYWAMLSR